MSKRESKRRLKRRSKSYRKAMMIVNIIFTCFIVFFAIYGFLHVFTDKNEYRDEGINLYNNKQYAAAIVSFDKAISCNQWFSEKIDIDCEMYKAECYINLEEYKTAKDIYNTILNNYSIESQDKEKVEFLINLCDALIKYSEGDFVSTVAVFVDAVNRGYSEFSLYAAICYENQNKFDKMKEYYDIYSADFGMDTYLYYKFSTYYILEEEYNKALDYIEDGYKASDDAYKKELMYAEIMCYEKMNEYARAFSLAEQYTNLYPDDAKGRDMYGYLDTRVNIDDEIINDIYDLNDSDTSNNTEQ